VVSNLVGYIWNGCLRPLGRCCRTLRVSVIPLYIDRSLINSGVGLWLWLGVLDAIQGAGLGMILLQTLSRLHVCATLALAQFIGSVTVMVARATSPTKVGPGNAFPNPGIWDIGQSGNNNPFGYWEFWVCLFCQIIIVVGFAFLFRKEQLSKP